MEKIILTIFVLILLPYAGIPSYFDQFLILFLIIALSWFIYDYAKKTLDVHHVHLPQLRKTHIHGPVTNVATGEKMMPVQTPVSQPSTVTTTPKPRVRKARVAPPAAKVLELHNDPVQPVFFTEDEKLEIKKTVQARTRKKAAE